MKLLFSCVLLYALFLVSCTRNFPGKGKYVFKVIAPVGYKVSVGDIEVVDKKGNPSVIENIKGIYSSDSSEFTSDPIQVGARITASADAWFKGLSTGEKKDITLRLQLWRGKKLVRDATQTRKGGRSISHKISVPYVAGYAEGIFQ